MSDFSDAPKARYIYANRQYPDCLWYFWDGDKHTPIESDALTGVITKVEVEEKVFRGKAESKLNVHIKASRRYVIQSGLDTIFAKGLLYTLSRLPAVVFATPIMIAVEPGETEQVLFCKIYNPVTQEPVYAPYPADVDWSEVLVRVQGKLEGTKNA